MLGGWLVATWLASGNLATDEPCLPRHPSAKAMEEALLSAKPHRTFAIRWWLLVLCSLMAGNQGGTWLVYGVIAEAVKPLYPGWTDGTIALLSQWGPVMYLVAVWPTSWLIDVKGLRTTMIAATALTFAGGLCRCIHHGTDATGAALVHAGQILNGLCGPVAMSIAPPLSAHWFAPTERNLATAIAATANYGGGAVFFLLGAHCVPPGAADVTRDRLWRFMLGECLFSAALLAATCLTFPARPPSPPSVSATLEREAPAGGAQPECMRPALTSPLATLRLTDRLPSAGLAKLVRSVPFWLLTISFGIVSGVFQSWGSMLGPILQASNTATEPPSHRVATATV